MAENTTRARAPRATKTAEVAEAKTAPIVAKEIDINQLITVRSGFHGRLIYKNSRTNEKFIWTEFGEPQYIELKELRNAKGVDKKFFINNWFMFDEEFEWVIDYLGMRQYYKNALTLDKFDEIFQKTPAEIEKAIAKMSDGQKQTVGYRARQLIADGEIDSNKAIAALERALNIELIER